MELKKLSWVEVKNYLNKNIKRFILPIGTIEPHGTHLPLGTDAIIPEELSLKIAEKTDSIVLPTIYYGVTDSLYGYPGSIRIEPEILENLIYDVMKSMIFNGFKEAVVMNGHGGSKQMLAIERACQRIWSDYRTPIIVINWWILARENKITEKYFNKEGGHAATDETSMIMAIDKKLVKRELYKNEEILVWREGVKTFPLEKSIINYSESEGSVVFEEERSIKYFNELSNLISKVINDYFNNISLKR
ncbi:MAG: creatininase family protein [Thermoproteota archaeon]